MAFDAGAKADAVAARQALDAAGHTAVTLLEVARDYGRRHIGARQGELPVAELIEDFLTHQQRMNRSTRTVGNLRDRLRRWAVNASLTRLADIDEDAINAIKLRADVAAQTRRNDMAAVSSFCSYLVRDRRLLPSNPLKGMTRPTVDRRTPRTLTAEQARELLTAAVQIGEGRIARYINLCLMAGLRPSEAAAVDPANVVLTRAERFVRVLAGKRRGHRRTVPLSPAFQAWWRITRDHSLPLFEQVRDRDLFNRVRRAAGLIPVGGTAAPRIWQNDICRHTWISARLAQTQNEAQVALEAGTSREMIHAHYLDWLTPKVAEAILSIRPKSGKIKK